VVKLWFVDRTRGSGDGGWGKRVKHALACKALCSDSMSPRTSITAKDSFRVRSLAHIFSLSNNQSKVFRGEEEAEVKSLWSL